MPESNRQSRKRVQTRSHIARTAFELFERLGYEAVTMEQIAAESDVARGTLYNHFPVKEAVLAHGLHTQLEHDLGPLIEDLLSRETFAARLETLLEASANWWEAHRHYAAPYIRHRFQEVRDGQHAQAASDMVTLYEQLIMQAQENRELDVNASPRRLAHYLHFLYLSAVMTWLSDTDASLGDEFTHVAEFFIQGATAGHVR